MWRKTLEMAPEIDWPMRPKSPARNRVMEEEFSGNDWNEWNNTYRVSLGWRNVNSKRARFVCAGKCRWRWSKLTRKRWWLQWIVGAAMLPTSTKWTTCSCCFCRIVTNQFRLVNRMSNRRPIDVSAMPKMIRSVCEGTKLGMDLAESFD